VDRYRGGGNSVRARPDCAPNVQGRSGLEVILQGVQGNELFRCRHKSSA
jgi:hypothetical protein